MSSRVGVIPFLLRRHRADDGTKDQRWVRFAVRVRMTNEGTVPTNLGSGKGKIRLPSTVRRRSSLTPQLGQAKQRFAAARSRKFLISSCPHSVAALSG